MKSTCRQPLQEFNPKTFLSFLFITLFFLFNSFAASAQPDGAKLFKANCASCHKPHKRMTGPALKGALDRVPSQEWLYSWVKNSQSLVKGGDDYANKIFNEYNQSIMTPNPLANEEIDAILAYVEAYKPPVPVVTDITETTDAGDGNAFWWLVVIALLLFMVISVMWGVKRRLANQVREAEGLEPLVDVSYMEEIAEWIGKNKKIVAILILVLLGVGTVKGWYALKGIGVYQGYAPEQPIKFSHKIHAGDNAINCIYCHHSAEKGRTAGIPSVNVCMNCHKGISEGKTTGTSEIAKIYEAAGFDPETQRYDKPQKPIKWIRVHSLPDFAYFNHSQHVVIGKQECKTCHGPVETMDVLEQHSELTMGWCLNCHNTTNVSMKGNEYYEKLHAQLKEKFSEEGRDVFTVREIGGFECVKCHY